MLTSRAAAPPPPAYRWVVCALLFAATATNYADRQVLALLKPSLDQQLHWTNTEYGLVNAAFQVAYAVGTLGFGWLIDRIGVRFGFLVIGVGTSVAAALHATVSTIGGFAGARFALGVAGSGNFPAGIKTIAGWFPVRERALAATLFNAGANVAAVVTPAAVPLLVSIGGWRWSFGAMAATGALWVLAWLFLYRPAPTKSTAVADGSPGTAAAAPLSWAELLRRRETWAFIVPKFITDPVWGLLLMWLPDYFNQTHHRALADSWPQLATVYAIVTIVSLAGGWLPERLIRHGWPVARARRTALLASALFAWPIVATSMVGLWGAVVLFGVAGAAHQAWSANVFTLVSDTFPERSVASVVGLGGLTSALGVSLFSVGSGKILDHYAARGQIGAGYQVLFAGFALTYTVALLAHHVLARRPAVAAT